MSGLVCALARLAMNKRFLVPVFALFCNLAVAAQVQQTIPEQGARDRLTQVMGIYDEEKHTPYFIAAGDRPVTHLTSVSYAVRDDAFRNWKPAMLGGKTVLEELRNSR